MKDLLLINRLVLDQFATTLTAKDAAVAVCIGITKEGKYVICADEQLDPQRLRKIFAQLEIMLNV